MNTSHQHYNNILIIDTATEACSAAIVTDGEVHHQFEICPQQQSQRILPMISDLCQRAGINIQQIDAIGFGHGPGSFTGVRIAIGTVQGLALGLDIPVVGVSTLAAMAQQVVDEQTGSKDILVAIDARMSEVYFGHYRCLSTESSDIELIGTEKVMSPEAAAEYSSRFPAAAYAGTGWQAYPNLHVFTAQQMPSVKLPNACFMVPETLLKLADKQVDSAETAVPVYLRDTVTWQKLPGRE